MKNKQRDIPAKPKNGSALDLTLLTRTVRLLNLRDRIPVFMSVVRNVATKGGVGSKNDRRSGTHFFEPGGYKIEPLLTKMVNDDI